MFQRALEQLVNRVQGALGAAVLSYEGLVIDAVSPEGADFIGDEALPQYAEILQQLLNVTPALDLGSSQEFTLESPERTILARVLNERYFVLLAVRPAVPPGRGHFHLRLASGTLSTLL